MPSREEIENALSEEYERLVKASARSTDECLAAKVIALGDPDVKERLVGLLGDGFVFRRLKCRNAGQVLVELDPPPGEIRFLVPSLLVSVDHQSQEVISADVVSEADELRFKTVGGSFLASEAKLTDVEVKLTGGLRRATVLIEGVAIPLRAMTGGASGKGQILVQPPHIDVDVDVSTGPYVTVTVAVTLNGKEQKKDIYVRGGRIRQPLQFGLAGFGLDGTSTGGGGS
jgi:hypothetical protein